MKWRKSGVVVALLALGLGVAACDPGGEDPTTPPTTDGTTTTDPTTEPTETTGPPEVDPPEVPDGMDVDDHQGAILAAGYFLDLYSYMRTSGDVTLFQAMSGPDCQFCSDAISNVEEMHGNGNWIEGGELAHDIGEATAEYPTADRPEYVVYVTATEQPFTMHYFDGTSDRSEDETVLELGIGVLYGNGQFTVVAVDYEQQ